MSNFDEFIKRYEHIKKKQKVPFHYYTRKDILFYLPDGTVVTEEQTKEFYEKTDEYCVDYDISIQYKYRSIAYEIVGIPLLENKYTCIIS